MAKRKKQIYEEPKSRDLSGFNVIGQVRPMGICQGGSSPISFTCADGPDPTQPSVCSPTGLLPTYGRCTLGNNAVEGCHNGSFVTQCFTGAGQT
jgi:hypothetical protein